MEQMYLLEVFIDKVTIFVTSDEDNGANKQLIIKIKFGPKIQFIIKEGQLAVNEDPQDDIVECGDNHKRQWSRTIRVGKSYLFPSYPDTVLMILSKFPLEIEVWNDDKTEQEIFVGIGTMHWETEFFHMLKDTADACKLHEPLSIKQRTPLMAECCCKQVGEIAFILRLSALGESIITEFQQLMKDPELFVFRTNKAPSMFQCKMIEGDDPNFCMVGSLYETTTLEDPETANSGEQKIEVCTELQSCGQEKHTADTCAHTESKNVTDNKYAINSIRMGDIVGPCGNTNCTLANKVRVYLRNLSSYKSKAQDEADTKPVDIIRLGTKKVCGKCDCKDDRWHREDCEDAPNPKVRCDGCKGLTQEGKTCEDQQNKLYETNYAVSVNHTSDLKKALFGQNFIIDNFQTKYVFQEDQNINLSGGCDCNSKKINTNEENQNNLYESQDGGCCCSKKMNIKNTHSNPNFCTSPKVFNSRNAHDQIVYNVDSKPPFIGNHNNIMTVYNCLELSDDKTCKCSPKKPVPPCKTFDCECLTEMANIDARKQHKPYCPAYKHKKNCPVIKSVEIEGNEENVDETEPLPYGLPPIRLGPCPVMGRPCTVPDGFARMYKNAVLQPLPPSYSDAGKVCCSKEFERIKKAIKEYMKYEKANDFRCINKFNVDTETRCCDKEQRLLSLTGKNCCSVHKNAIQEQFKKQ